MFICIVYDMSEAELPPNLVVMTAAAVAVGQTKHIIADSSNTFTTGGIPRKKPMESEITINMDNWNSKSHRCHQDGFSSITRTLQKVTKSIEKISPGCTTETTDDTRLPVPSGNGRSLYRRYINTPPVMAIGSDQSRRN
jgi:hypothetical protein